MIPQLADDYYEYTGEELPLGPGWGQSRDDPIVIYADTSEQSAKIEYKILDFWAAMRQEKYRLIKQTLLRVNGKLLDQIKIEWEGDQENYYNFYFDVSGATLDKSTSK